MKKKLIFGMTNLADILFEYLKKDQIDIEAFVVNREYQTENIHFSKPVICFEDIQHFFSPELYSVYLCLGYHNMNDSRKRIFHEIKSKGYSLANYKHASSVVMTEDMGEGNIILDGVSIGPFTKIGDGNIFYSNAVIAHHALVGNFNYFSISASLAGNTRIGNNCFMGNNATTKDGIIIGNYSLIGAGAYVHDNIVGNTVIVPERSIVLETHSSKDFFI